MRGQRVRLAGQRRLHEGLCGPAGATVALAKLHRRAGERRTGARHGPQRAANVAATAGGDRAERVRTARVSDLPFEKYFVRTRLAPVVAEYSKKDILVIRGGAGAIKD